jgi:hypothetical protein
MRFFCCLSGLFIIHSAENEESVPNVTGDAAEEDKAEQTEEEKKKWTGEAQRFPFTFF